MSARPESAGIAGLCFLSCGLIVGLAYLSTLIRQYGPVVREVILATVTPQFAAGMFFMAFLLAVVAWCVARGKP